MADRYASFANTGPGRAIVSRLGLPRPAALRRYRDGDPVAAAPVIVGGGGRLAGPAQQMLTAAGVEVRDEPTAAEGTLAGLVYDATALTEPDALGGLFDFFHPLARTLRPSGRVVVLGTPP